MKISNSNEPLIAIICGFEHSGTTLITEILRQHPKLDSGFEGGFLLCNESIDFLTNEPFYTNVKGGWGVSDSDLEFICLSDTWSDVYKKLRDRSSALKDKDCLIFDKTPRYMQKLSDVLSKVPGVPCVVITRDLRSVFWSSFKRTGASVETWQEEIFPITYNHTVSYLNGLRKAIDDGFRDRILIVKYESLCLRRGVESSEIFKFLDLDFREEFLSFESVRYRHVHGDSVSQKYMTEYKGKLPNRVCDKALGAMQKHEDWFVFTE